MSKKIQALKDYAESRYDEGFDVFVECNSDEEWADLLASNDNSVTKAKAEMCQLAGVYLERQNDAIISAGADKVFSKDFDSAFDAQFN